MARSVELIVSGGSVRTRGDYEGPVTHGERTAISVEFTDPERVAGVEPGSSVAIFVSEDPEPYLAGGSARKLPPLTRILLPTVQVLGVGVPTAGRTVLTIALTRAEAEKIICGSRNGDLTFALRGDRSQVPNRPAASGRAVSPELYDSAS